MLNTTINGWNIQETETGMKFEHFCNWKPVSRHRLPELLKGYAINGAFEDDEALILTLVKDGNFKLLKIETTGGRPCISIIDEITMGAFRRIFMAYQEGEDHQQNKQEV